MPDSLPFRIPQGTQEAKRRALQLAHDHVVPGRIDKFAEFGISLVMGTREGYRFRDLDGHEYMDFHLNGGVFSLGHRNPDLIRVLRDALDEFDIGNHHFPSAARADLAAKLCRLSPGGKGRYVVFCSGGSEANDVAIKSARFATGRRKIVALEVAYHGRTVLSGALGEDSHARYFHGDYPGECLKVPFNDLPAIETALRNRDVAGVIMETIPATYGFPVLDDGYLPGVKRLCEQYGSLYICDEVQTGLGRTGRLWGIECWGVEPDILVTAKGTSGGLYPIAATLLSERAGSWLKDNGWGHVSSFGGAEVGCVVLSRVLDMCNAPATLANVTAISDHFHKGFISIQQRHPWLVEIRRKGLVMGLRFDHPNGAVHMMKALYDNGIWAIFSSFDSSVLQWKPGLLVDRAYCDEALEKFERALPVATAAGSRGGHKTSFLRAGND